MDMNIIKNYCSDNRNKSWICLGFTYCFMICIFAPLEAYFANIEEFWFSFLQIFLITVGVFALSLIAFLAIFMCVKRAKLAVWMYGFIFCTMLYLYIQGNYVPRDYGVLDGAEIQWDSYSTYAGVSITLIIVFFAFWIGLQLMAKEKIYEIGSWICKGLVAVQLVTLLILGIQHGVGEKETKIVTTESMFDLSTNKNILVFILDTFDSADMQELLSDDKKYERMLEDFTYYPDTLGKYPTTIGAVPYILTGEEYVFDRTYIDWIDTAYEDSTIYSTMNNNEYVVELYTDPRYIATGYAENVRAERYVIGNYSNFAKATYKLVAFNYMPHQLKRFFSVESGEFDELKSSKKYDVYSKDTTKFFKRLKSEGLTFSDKDNNFKVYHVDGTHAPYTFDGMMVSETDKVYDVYDEVEGCIHLLDEYMQILKNNNAYDNTAIIIMADHGHYDLGQNPVFMIKNFEEKKPFTISDAKMSWNYLDEIFISLSSDEKIDAEYIRNCAGDSTIREYSYYTWDDDWDRQYLPEITDYLVYGDARDIGKFECAKEFPYHLGDVLPFERSKTIEGHCAYGISSSDSSGAWTNARYAIMPFDWSGAYENILLTIGYGAVNSSSQTVIVYANQHKVSEFVAEGAEKQEIVIPHQFVDEGRLTLIFEFPDCFSPKERGTGEDSRKLALYMQTISLSSTDKSEIENSEMRTYSYELGRTLSFGGENATANEFCTGGFSNNEENFTWTSGKRAEMEFNIYDEYNDLLLDFTYLACMDVQHVIIYVNDKKIEDYMTEEAKSRQIVIPNEYVENDRIKLRFEMPDAISPKDNGTGEDVRVLGLAMSSLTISSVE